MLERAHRHLNARVSEREIGGKAPKYFIAKRECFSQVPSKPIKVTLLFLFTLLRHTECAGPCRFPVSFVCLGLSCRFVSLKKSYLPGTTAGWSRAETGPWTGHETGWSLESVLAGDRYNNRNAQNSD